MVNTVAILKYMFDVKINNSLYAFQHRHALDRWVVFVFDLIFTKRYLARSGYDNPQFTGSLSLILTFDKGQYPTWKNLTLYKIGKIK